MRNTLASEVDEKAVAGEIYLLRASGNKTILIVEGDSDSKFFRSYVDVSSCEIVISRGRDNALKALHHLKERKYLGVLAVIDRDYDDFLGIIHNCEDIIVNSEHDIEIMMVKSPAFEKLLVELGSAAKLSEIQKNGVTPREIVASAAHGLGVIRLFSKKRGVNLKFESLSYSFVESDLTMSDEEMIVAVKNHSRKFDLDHGEVLEQLAEWRQKEHDRWMMCCGHDVTALIARGVRSLFGTNSSKAHTAEDIESRLRLAFGEAQFRVTQLFQDIRSWETRNVPYIVLAAI